MNLSLQRVYLLTQREVSEPDGGVPSSPAGVGGPTSDTNLQVGTNHEYLPPPTASRTHSATNAFFSRGAETHVTVPLILSTPQGPALPAVVALVTDPLPTRSPAAIPPGPVSLNPQNAMPILP